MSLWFPEIDDVLLIHQRIAAYTGGSTGVREIGLIESALARAMRPSAVWMRTLT